MRKACRNVPSGGKRWLPRRRLRCLKLLSASLLRAPSEKCPQLTPAVWQFRPSLECGILSGAIPHLLTPLAPTLRHLLFLAPTLREGANLRTLPRPTPTSRGFAARGRFQLGRFQLRRAQKAKRPRSGQEARPHAERRDERREQSVGTRTPRLTGGCSGARGARAWGPVGGLPGAWGPAAGPRPAWAPLWGCSGPGFPRPA